MARGRPRKETKEIPKKEPAVAAAESDKKEKNKRGRKDR